MKKPVNKFFLYVPLLLVEAFLIATLLLYQFGPITWETENVGMFWFFIAAYHVVFIGGYALSVEKIKLSEPSWRLTDLQPKSYRWVIWAVIALCAVCACIEYRNLTRSTSYIPYELPRNFINGLLNPADQYYSKSSGEFEGNKLITLASALASFVYVSLIPLMVVEWKRLSIPQRICLMFLILFKVVVYVSIGTNKGIFDTMFGFVGILAVLLLLNGFHRTDEHIDKKTFAIIGAFALFLALFSVSYFTINISDRLEMELPDKIIALPTQTEAVTEAEEEEYYEEEEEWGEEEEERVEEEEEEWVEEEQPHDSFVERMFEFGTDYLTQGYYGMSLALDEEFTTTYGIGSSQFLRSNFYSLFGIDVTERTYQHKVSDQWHETGKWHSFYSYVANDVSFYGVIVVMFLLGLFYGCICKDVIVNNSLVGKLILPLFIIMFMYLPANNQIFTAMATCTAFLELAFLWVASKLPFVKRILSKVLRHGE